MATDLALFDFAFDLPAPTFSQVAPDGLTPFDITSETQVNWAGEIALDVQWAHAMAPGAAIALVLAKSADDADINSAVGTRSTTTSAT
jgi:subtilase family serine protease